jgi:hypothetical protein
MKRVKILFPIFLLVIIFGYVIFEHETQKSKTYEIVENVDVDKDESEESVHDMASSTQDIYIEESVLDGEVGTSTATSTDIEI